MSATLTETELKNITNTATRALALIYDIAATHGSDGNKLNYEQLERITDEIAADIKRAKSFIQEQS